MPVSSKDDLPCRFQRAMHRPHSIAGAPGGAGAAPVDIAHKAVVLRCIQAMCENGQLLVDLFVNYDCDLEVRGGLQIKAK